MKRSVFLAVIGAAVLHYVTSAQQIGPNVNVLTGTDPNTGDAYLQRQNEAVVAVSTRNSDHVMVAMNDYRTVDMAFDPGLAEGNYGLIARARQKPGDRSVEAMRAQTPPEAWIGLGFSRDRGQTFYTALLPGYPQDTSAVGKASPVYGDNAGSDPVLLTGQNGRVYLIALTFDRGGISRITSTRYTDRNYVEGGEPFYFDFTKQIDRGALSSKGRFGDKPSAAAYAGGGSTVFSTSGVSKKKKQIVVVPGCERLYTAYTIFDGNDANGHFNSSVYVSVSASCGEVWSNPVKVNGPYSVNGANNPGTKNQGTATAVDPDSGDVYIVWRTYEPNGLVYVRSTDGGLTFSTPKPLFTGTPALFDQPLLTKNDGQNVFTFRSNAYPSLTVYDGKLIVVWSERVNLTTGLPDANGSPRSVLSIGTLNADGSVSWTPRKAIDLKDPGAATANTRCEQEVPVAGPPAVTTCRPTGAQVMPYVVARDGQVLVVYYEARSDQDAPGGIAPGTGYISGMQRQIDVRAALLDPLTWTLTSSFQVSRYSIDPWTGRLMENPNAPDPKLKRRVNYANYPMYRGGIAAFIGDYLHSIPLRPDGSGPGFRIVFTTNELVDPPADLDFTQYSKPQQGFLGTCNPGSRNSTIMTSEVGTGLIIGSPGTFKQLLNGQNQPVQRAFAVYVENHTPAYRAYRLTFTTIATGVTASFDQFTSVPSVDVEVLAGSSVTRSVFLSGNTATGSVVVNAQEIQLPDPAPDVHAATSLNQSASLTLNGDATNPFVGGPGGNPGLANTETHTPQLESPQLGTPQLGSPQIGSPQLGTPQLGTPQLGTPQLGTPQLSTPQLGSNGPTDPYYTDITYKVTNEGNTASGFNSLISLANAPHLQQSGHSFQVFLYRVHQTAAVNGCGVGKSQQDQIIYQTPQLGSPQLGTPQLGTPQIGSPQLGTPQLGSPQLGTPQLGTPQLGTPQLASASFTIAPGDPTPNDHDGTIHEHQANDALYLTVRVIHPPNENVPAVHPDVQSEFATALAVAVEAQAADTGQTEPDQAFADQLPPDTTILAAPHSPTPSSTAIITFEGTDNLTAPDLLTFECSLDAGAFVACASPATFTGLAPGAHTVSVRAIDGAGNPDPQPATSSWTIVAPTVTITSTKPGTAAAGFGQLITVFTDNAPVEGMPIAFFTQGATTAQGFVFTTPSHQNEYYVRLPFPGDNVPDDNPNDGVAPGPAFVHLQFGGATLSQDFPLTVSTTPGTPEARFVLGLVDPPNADNQCGTALTSATPITHVLPGQGIAISAYGFDTTGARAVFTQGGTTIEVGPTTCSYSGPTFGVASVFVVPANLAPGTVSVQVKTAVNNVQSALSNALNLTVDSVLLNFPPPGGANGDFIDRGFYVPSYPGSSLSTVTVWLTTATAGTYTIAMTARSGSYGGTVIGTSSATATLPADLTTLTPVTFVFPSSPAVTPGTLVTFAMSQTSPVGLSVYYDIGTCGLGVPDCPTPNPTKETEGTQPPLDTFRRNGVSVRITGSPQ